MGQGGAVVWTLVLWAAASVAAEEAAEAAAEAVADPNEHRRQWESRERRRRAEEQELAKIGKVTGQWSRDRRQVWLELSLRNIQSVGSDGGSATLTWSVRLSWREPSLGWEGAEGGGDGPLSLHPVQSQIWTPHVSFDHNAVAVERDRGRGRAVAELWPNGLVTTLDTYTVRLTIRLDTADFPMDEQEVQVALSFGLEDLELRLGAQNLSGQYDQLAMVPANTEWVMGGLECRQGLRPLLFPAGSGAMPPARRPFVLCRLRLRRKAAFYVFNFVLPSIMITFLGITGQFLAELRPSQPKPNKTQIALAAVMALGVLTMGMGNSVPRDSALSRLHSLYYLNIALAITAAFSSAVRLPAVFVAEGRGGRGGEEPATEATQAGPDSPDSTSFPHGPSRPPPRVHSPKWEWRFQAALFALHILVLFVPLAIFLSPLLR